MKSPNTTQTNDTGIVDNGNGAEDREEGEIVDEYEMIISSEDEEFKLRARIEQLEDKSKDIEKMEMLSLNLSNQYNYQRPQRTDRYMRYQNFTPISVLSDVSSMSEEEAAMMPKKSKRHKMKKSESKKHLQFLRRNPFAPRIHGQSEQTRKKRRQDQYNYYQQHKSHHQNIVLDSLDSVTDDEVGEYDLNVENENDDYENLDQRKLSRNKLLVALAREGNYDIKPKHSLRERLQYRMRKSPSPSPTPAEKQLKHDDLPANSFEGYSQLQKKKENEQEQQQQPQFLDTGEEPPELKLRLIALKSAILKKHFARKKRDAERAYSPTDMINRVHPPTISNECDDIDDLMEISPAASPDRTANSPPPAERFEEPVDMDLVQTDSDEDKQQWPHNWQSTMNSGGSWRCYYSNSLPPVSMPIVVDEEDELDQQQRQHEQFVDDDDEVPPPPPPFHIPHMQLEDDDARDALHLSEQQNSNHGSYTDIQSISMDNSQTQMKSSRSFPQESSDDEAGTLRAMLLAKLKPAESAPIKKALPVLVPAVENLENKTEAHDSDDPEELRLLLLSSIASKKKSSKEDICGDSPEILKNAVRRFQISSLTPDLPEQDDEIPATEDVVPEPLPLPSLPQLTLPPTVELPLPVPVPLPVPPPQLAVETTKQSPSPTPIQVIPPPATNIIKIVKPNKVINKKTAPKRKISKLAESEPLVKRPTALVAKEIATSQREEVDTGSTRLITTLNPASIKVNKLVITLADSSAGSDDELEFTNSAMYSSYIGYADNQSPLSQAMESASNSTTRSNTPNSEIVDSTATSNSNLRRTVINEYFERKLDDFLKEARAKVPTATPSGSSKTLSLEGIGKQSDLQAKSDKKPAAQKTKPTPVAVRHLPVASQKEYLQLIERMQLLENKKFVPGKASKSQSGTAKTANATGSKLVKRTVPSGPPKGNSNSSSNSNSNSSSSISSSNNNGKPATTTKSEAIKNGSSTADTSKACNLPTTSVVATKATQPSKESRLKAFESSFHKIGGSMITNLDKSLMMVEEAKKSKITRLRYSRRLEDLMIEMQAIKQAVKLEEAKIARIQPEIQTSHEIIISLKQKRKKLRDAAVDLGKGLKGADYRLLDPIKAEIIKKSNQLSKDIRLYNSIVKYKDITEPVDDPTPKKQAQTELQPHSESEPSLATEPANAQHSSQPSTLPPADKEFSLRIEEEPQQRQETSECIRPEDVAVAVEEEKEDAVRTEKQLDDDTTLRNAAMLDSRKESLDPVPPYPVGRMRELCEPPYGKSLFGEYHTPMPQNYNRQFNVNATVCPFELMGRCEDTDCSYLHLTRVTTGEDLVTDVSAAVEQ